MSSYKYKELETQLRKNNVTSCIIHRNGSEEFRYFRSRSETEIYKVNSITKSILSMLIGIALTNGNIPSIQEPISNYFPLLKKNTDGKEEIRIDHLLTMTSGLDWPGNENLKNADNWGKYILDRPMQNKAGEVMQYNCGNSHLLSLILQMATGIETREFAEKNLFKPLNIHRYIWETDPQGNAIGGFGLKLQSNDLLKLGQLCLTKGKYGDRQIISEDWLKKSTNPHVKTKIGSQMYGYHWWVNIPMRANQSRFYYAAGTGGQYIIVVPGRDLITIFTSEMTKAEGVKPYRWFVNDIL
ncbi:serine hydrolase domain-containing protein [Evansella tamaricis]|uniref:Beta-lactamase family protein n=1 Tax=Evansella tamaricis TaxID=2069301 RepID=A0ABS6JIL2_9BACI|nr:serine hydrolase [Evansella tamaricis]MBU9713426.1 beta-lactamase family protein [Evansella tamaricis]